MAELTQVEVQEVVDTAEALGRVAGRQLVMVGVIAGGGGIVTGFTVGYLVARRRLWAKYAKMAEDEIAEMRLAITAEKERLANMEKPDPEKMAQDLGYVSVADAQEKIQANPDEHKSAQTVIENVFDQPEPDTWSYEAEEKARGDYSKPFVIHKDEFDNERPDTHTDATLTYFEMDDVLADERDIPVDDMDELVGLENLEKFGHGSGDPNVVYIRNRPRRIDLEIVKSFGSFAEEVGASPPGEEDGELRHSERRRPFDDER